MLLNGRYGPYLVKDKQNYRLPKGTMLKNLPKKIVLRLSKTMKKPKKVRKIYHGRPE